MFSIHSRGDLIQYLESEGFTVPDNEDIEDIRAACCMHAQAVAIYRSPLFREVMANAERVMRKALYENAIPTIDSAPPGEFDDSYPGW
jgi:hypothetical protein